MKKARKTMMSLALAILFVMGTVTSSFATWHVLYDTESGNYDAWYVDDGRDGEVTYMECAGCLSEQ